MIVFNDDKYNYIMKNKNYLVFKPNQMIQFKFMLNIRNIQTELNNC